jgi:hypothetical protein
MKKLNYGKLADCSCFALFFAYISISVYKKARNTSLNHSSHQSRNPSFHLNANGLLHRRATLDYCVCVFLLGSGMIH